MPGEQLERHLKARPWKQRIVQSEDGREREPTFDAQQDLLEIEKLSESTGLSRLAARVCFYRGIKDPKKVLDFFRPSLSQITNPNKIKDMELAVSLVAQARAESKKILVFGDYDVDGTTGAALLTWVFREIGIQSKAIQPDRFKDGYGVNKSAIEQAHADGFDLIVTVDCGITSFEALNLAFELGIKVIVIDHHQVDPKGLPKAAAILNPHRSDCESGLTQLCGCGLAFYFSMALRTFGRDQGWFGSGKDQLPEPNLKQHLDLVVLATAADQVPLVGDNRILVSQGLEVLRNTQKPGYKALMDVAGVTINQLSPGHLGFVLGPRINASGRMQSAALALELLTTQDKLEGLRLAQTLERLNKERAETQNQIWDQVKSKVEQGLKEKRFQHAIVLGDENWHEGVVGIVASRVTETFRKPAIVISIHGEKAKGSVRSYGGKDALQALRECSHLLVGFGGHKVAAGVSLESSKLIEFAVAFDEAIGKLSQNDEELPLWIEGECDIGDLDIKTLLELERMGPFGPGNPEPVFSISAKVRQSSVIKGRHLKLDLAAPGSNAYKPITMEAIWFHAADRKHLIEGSTATERSSGPTYFAAVPEINRFRGRTTPTLRVKDFRALRG